MSVEYFDRSAPSNTQPTHINEPRPSISEPMPIMLDAAEQAAISALISQQFKIALAGLGDNTATTQRANQADPEQPALRAEHLAIPRYEVVPVSEHVGLGRRGRGPFPLQGSFDKGARPPTSTISSKLRRSMAWNISSLRPAQARLAYFRF